MLIFYLIYLMDTFIKHIAKDVHPDNSISKEVLVYVKDLTMHLIKSLLKFHKEHGIKNVAILAGDAEIAKQLNQNVLNLHSVFHHKPALFFKKLVKDNDLKLDEQVSLVLIVVDYLLSELFEISGSAGKKVISMKDVKSALNKDKALNKTLDNISSFSKASRKSSRKASRKSSRKASRKSSRKASRKSSRKTSSKVAKRRIGRPRGSRNRKTSRKASQKSSRKTSSKVAKRRVGRPPGSRNRKASRKASSKVAKRRVGRPRRSRNRKTSRKASSKVVKRRVGRPRKSQNKK